MASSSARAHSRRRLAVAGGVVVLGGLSFLAWTAAPNLVDQVVLSGPRLAISVVAPVEPIPVEGSVMEVGEITDGFDRAALNRPAEVIEADFLPPDAYAGEPDPAFDYQPLPSGPLMVDPAAPQPEPVRDPLADGSRSFGFDRIGLPPRYEPAPAPSLQPAANDPARRSQNFFQ